MKFPVRSTIDKPSNKIDSSIVFFDVSVLSLSLLFFVLDNECEQYVFEFYDISSSVLYPSNTSQALKSEVSRGLFM